MSGGLSGWLCMAVALLSMNAFGAGDPAQPRDRTVHIVCRHTQTYFDVSMNLDLFGEDIAPNALLDSVAEKKGRLNEREWISRLSILRWSSDARPCKPNA